MVSIYNDSSSDQTITHGDSAPAGDGGTGNKTLAGYGLCTVLCVTSNELQSLNGAELMSMMSMMLAIAGAAASIPDSVSYGIVAGRVGGLIPTKPVAVVVVGLQSTFAPLPERADTITVGTVAAMAETAEILRFHQLR